VYGNLLSLEPMVNGIKKRRRAQGAGYKEIKIPVEKP
jgi:hypothetical protein